MRRCYRNKTCQDINYTMTVLYLMVNGELVTFKLNLTFFKLYNKI